MRGHERIRKKHLRQAGWDILEESQPSAGQYQLVLCSAKGERQSVDAPSRPRAYRRAEQMLCEPAQSATAKGAPVST